MKRFLILFACLIGIGVFAGAPASAEECVATVGCPGKLTIELKAGANDPDFLFRSEQVGDFYLEDTSSGRRATFYFEEPTRVVINEVEPNGWQLVDIDCKRERGSTRISEANERLTVDIELDQSIKCIFVNEREATPTPTVTSTVVPTVVPTATPVVPTPGPSAEAIALLEQANANKALAEAIKNQPAPVIIVDVPSQPVNLRITPPNTGDGGLAGPGDEPIDGTYPWWLKCGWYRYCRPF